MKCPTARRVDHPIMIETASLGHATQFKIVVDPIAAMGTRASIAVPATFVC
jgi:hypothetical protein